MSKRLTNRINKGIYGIRRGTGKTGSGMLDMQGVGGSSPLVLTSLNVPEAFIYKGFGDFFAFYSAAV